MALATMIMGTIVDIASISLIIVYMFCLPKAIHIFQQESYQFRDYFRWITKNPKQAFGGGVKQFLLCLLYFVCMILIDAFIIFKLDFSYEIRVLIYTIQLLLLYAIFYISTFKLIFKWKKERKEAKKKLVYTARVKRLIFWCFLSTFLVSTAFVGTPINVLELVCLSIAQKVLVYSGLICTMPAIVMLGAFLAYPTEMFISDHYINSARFKILRPKYKNLIRIGITGSYGKTSTKVILKTILSEKYNVLATPESYNTTMGNVKIIREKLEPEHQVFISEMGARYKNDIRKICDFVYPQIGIITSIGPQHLESFKTIENVAKTKSELLNALPSNGVIALPNDDSFCSKLYANEKTRKKISFSVDNKNSDVYAKKIKMSEKGCEFIAVTPIGEIKCISKLLGKHNIQNILGAIAIAIQLDLSKEQISRGVLKLQPVEHRLQILPNSNGTIVIDDAFNSNPVGSKAAIDVLKNFEGRKIVITPGMVELGEKENEFNKEFGNYMADCVDIAILVGIKRSKPIEEGLIEKGFDKMNIYVVENLNSATQKLAELSKVGDVILFENDLPDNYNEE